MAATVQYILGSEARCTDGVCGVVVRILIDPHARKVTHLMVEPAGRVGLGRLVPLKLVAVDGATAGAVELTCDVAAFEKLERADEVQLAPEVGAALFGYGGGGVVMRAAVHEIVPPGDAELGEDEPALATDREFGHLHGLLADTDDHRITRLLFQVGHLWGRKVVAIPISAVIGFDDDVRLSLSEQEVLDLPSFDVGHPDAIPSPG